MVLISKKKIPPGNPAPCVASALTGEGGAGGGGGGGAGRGSLPRPSDAGLLTLLGPSSAWPGKPVGEAAGASRSQALVALGPRSVLSNL